MANGSMLVIPADMSQPITKVDLAAPPTLEMLQRAVGGKIELIPQFGTVPAWASDAHAIRNPGQAPLACDAYCNDEGKLDGLPVNLRATVLWGLACPVRLDDVLAGNVAIVIGDGIAGV